jgi:omega-amidase
MPMFTLKHVQAPYPVPQERGGANRPEQAEEDPSIYHPHDHPATPYRGFLPSQTHAHPGIFQGLEFALRHFPFAISSPIRLYMRAHLVQMDIAWEDKAANHARVERLLDRADVREGDLVILPEMFDTGFSFEVERTADRDSSTLRFLIRIAEDLGIYIIGGRTVHACHACLAHNRATAISPSGDLLADYSKIHPFTFGREAERFEGGDEVQIVTWAAATIRSEAAPVHGAVRSTGAAIARAAGKSAAPPRSRHGDALRICPAICYDLRFPELFRIGLLKGAEAFAVIANWPHIRQHAWRSLLIARAIENQAFVLAVNRTGSDPNLAYAGGSLALGPSGEILGELDDEEAVLTVDVNPAHLHAWRDKFPAWRDLRLIELPAR